MPLGRISARWSDIIGADAAVEALQQAVSLPLRFPELFLVPAAAVGEAPPRPLDDPRDAGVAVPSFPWRALLLYGPPGTGKTVLAQATAAEAEATLVSVSAADLLSKWVGESEKCVRRVFSAASRVRGRCVLFLDEIDALCSARGAAGETEAARRIKTEFLVQMQRLHRAQHVLLLAATNFPWELDAAFCRRFDQFIYVGLPDSSARFRILCRALSAARLGAAVKTLVAAPARSPSVEATDPTAAREPAGTSADLAVLTVPVDSVITLAEVRDAAMRLEGYSGSDLVALAKHALIHPVRRLQRATHFRFENDAKMYVACSAANAGSRAMKLLEIPPGYVQPLPLRGQDLFDAIAFYPRTCTTVEVERYERWNARCAV